MAVTELNAEQFAAAVAEGTCIVDFYASWCGPCKMMAPVIDSAAMSMPQINFYKVDVDKAANLAMEYKIVNVPTIMIFKDGQPSERIVGMVSKAELLEKINN